MVNDKRKLSLRRRKPEAISGEDCFAEFTLSIANVLAMTIICHLIYTVTIVCYVWVKIGLEGTGESIRI